MVHRIGVVLTLEGHTGVVLVAAARLGLGTSAREPVARVEHHAGLRREHLDAASRPRVAQLAHLAQDVGLPAVDDEGVVVAAEVADVVELRVDAGSQGAEGAEVLRRPLDVEDAPRGNLPFVHLQHVRRVEPQLVVEHRARMLAREVDVDVVRQVDGRCPVALGQIGDFERVVVVEVEDRLDVHLARVALVAILRREGHHHAVLLHAALPDAVGEVLRAAVQVVHAVVHLEPVLLALDRHPPVGNPVGHAAHALAQRRAVVEVALGMLVSQRHVVDVPLAVGDLN